MTPPTAVPVAVRTIAIQATVRKCIECGQRTIGSIGAAGLYWPCLCQSCKDFADNMELLMVVAMSGTLRVPRPPVAETASERTGAATTIRKCATCDREAIHRHTHCAHCEARIDEARDERDAQREREEDDQVRRTGESTQVRLNADGGGR